MRVTVLTFDEKRSRQGPRRIEQRNLIIMIVAGIDRANIGNSRLAFGEYRFSQSQPRSPMPIILDPNLIDSFDRPGGRVPARVAFRQTT